MFVFFQIEQKNWGLKANFRPSCVTNTQLETKSNCFKWLSGWKVSLLSKTETSSCGMNTASSGPRPVANFWWIIIILSCILNTHGSLQVNSGEIWKQSGHKPNVTMDSVLLFIYSYIGLRQISGQMKGGTAGGHVIGLGSGVVISTA